MNTDTRLCPKSQDGRHKPGTVEQSGVGDGWLVATGVCHFCRARVYAEWRTWSNDKPAGGAKCETLMKGESETDEQFLLRFQQQLLAHYTEATKRNMEIINSLEAEIATLRAKAALADRAYGYLKAKAERREIPSEDIASRLWVKDYDALSPPVE